MNKKYKFLTTHPKLYYLYGTFRILISRFKGIGKSGDCVMCIHCKNKRCVKNKIAEKFRLAKSLSCKCYEPIKENSATAEE